MERYRTIIEPFRIFIEVVLAVAGRARDLDGLQNRRRGADIAPLHGAF